MDNVISATKAVRQFSSILNHIRYKGEHYIIERSGKPIAFMGPLGRNPTRSLRELKSILEQVPRLGEEVEALAKDIEELRRRSPHLPIEEPWD